MYAKDHDRKGDGSDHRKQQLFTDAERLREKTGNHLICPLAANKESTSDPHSYFATVHLVPCLKVL
jgi:hypothetical protein